jgi:hypothetical protein
VLESNIYLKLLKMANIIDPQTIFSEGQISSGERREESNLVNVRVGRRESVD